MEQSPNPAAVTGDAWLDDYYARYVKVLSNRSAYRPIVQFYELALAVRRRNGKMMFAGNGASASIASHGAVDFTKQGRVTSRDFNEPNLITCFSNDFGYDKWIAKAVEFYAAPGDALVLISVSGKSPSVVNAAHAAKERGLPVVGFTGSAPDNPLRALSDVDFWVGSRAYNVVECVHMMWMMTVVDMLVGRAEYTVS
jgi:D-sedoheptulose 7-phosphate isomerase